MTGNVGSKNSRPLWALAFVVIVLAAITIWVRTSGSGTATPAATADVEGAGGDTNVDDSQASADALARRRQQASTPLSAADMHERVKQSTARRERQRAEHASKTEAARQQALATYRTERVDPSWAPGKETELDTIAASAAIAQANVDPKSLDVDCKRTMCRLNGTFATSSAADDWTMLYMSSVGSTLPNAVVSRSVNPDGSTSVEIYGRAR